MEAPTKVAVLLLLIVIATIEVHSEFVEHALKKFYVNRNAKVNWFEAWNYCRENNMELVTIETNLQQWLLAEALGKHFDFWTSGNENGWPSPNTNNRYFIWATTGRRLQNAHWLPGEPNNKGGNEHCIMTRTENFKWSDENCYTKVALACQY